MFGTLDEGMTNRSHVPPSLSMENYGEEGKKGGQVGLHIKHTFTGKTTINICISINTFIVLQIDYKQQNKKTIIDSGDM